LIGGYSKEHLLSCDAETNKEKERCICTTELINEKVYAYRQGKFLTIQHYPARDDYADKLKRFGHSLVTGPDGCIYMLCGFAQYLGYLVDIIRFKPKADIKNKTFFFESDTVDVGRNMMGRMNATCEIVQNNIIVFGGLKDNHTLNDLWVINLTTQTARGVQIETKWIYPRFGMSSVLNISPSDERSARLIVFGGSYWSGRDLVYGMTNEIVVFNLKFADETFNELDVVKCLPMVYGKGSMRIFHRSIYFQNKMYIFGGHNNLLLKMNFPEIKALEYKKPLSDYIKECKYNKIKFFSPSYPLYIFIKFTGG
jgi:hypothetical protein